MSSSSCLAGNIENNMYLLNTPEGRLLVPKEVGPASAATVDTCCAHSNCNVQKTS
jgi:hypothetical protein